MDYFQQFPRFLAKVGDEQKVITDFFIRVGVGQRFVKYAAMLLPYQIKDGDRPETVAFDVYGAATYYWVILLLNNIVDPRNEWPLSQSDLEAKALAAYDDIYALHHTELAFTGTEIAEESVPLYAQADLIPITNWDYEIRENDNKRSIVLIDPKYLAQFLQNFKNEVNS
jgi:hypothetical protein